MDKKELFRAIDACEDRFIREAAEDIQKRKSSIIPTACTFGAGCSLSHAFF